MNEIRKLMEAIEKIDENYGGGHYNAPDVRKTTNKILELMDEEMMDPRQVADAALSYMSESEVHDMARANDWLYGMGVEDDDGFEESIEMIDESVDNQEVELHLVRAADALARDAVKQAVGVYTEEGPGTGKFRSGAQNVHQYVEWAAPRFLSPDYQKDIMEVFVDLYKDAVRQALQDYSENRR